MMPAPRCISIPVLLLIALYPANICLSRTGDAAGDANPALCVAADSLESRKPGGIPVVAPPDVRYRPDSNGTTPPSRIKSPAPVSFTDISDLDKPITPTRSDLLASQCPAVPFHPPPAGSRYDGYARAGYGLLSSPLLEAAYARDFPRGDLFLQGRYDRNASSDHYPGYDHLYLRAGGGSYLAPDLDPFLARSRIQGEVQFRRQSYPHEPALIIVGEPAPFRWSTDRSDYWVTYGGELISRENRIIDYRARLFAEHSRLNDAYTRRAPLRDTSFTAFENIFGLSLSVEKEIEGTLLRGNADAVISSNSTTPVAEHSPIYFSIGGNGSRRLHDRLEVRAGLKLVIHRGSVGEFTTRLCPMIRLQAGIHQDWNAFALYEADVVRNSLRRLADINPFLSHTADIEHEDIPVKVQAGIEYSGEDMPHARLYAEYLRAHSLAQIIRVIPKDQQSVSESWEAYYGDNPDIFSIKLFATTHISTAGTMSLRAVVRASTGGVTGGRIPYLPGADIKAVYDHHFKFPLLISATLQFIGPRTTPDRELPAFLSAGAGAEYRFHDRISCFLRITNALNQRYQEWEGYEARGFHALAGLGITY